MTTHELELLFDELFPIMRSITGDGYRQSLAILERFIPFKRFHVQSGVKVFDWTVPPEWKIRSARLTAPDGRIIADIEHSNLCVLNYSAPVDVRLTLQELQEHLYSLPNLPDAVPYVTSYYNRRWGFCLSDRVRQSLTEGVYHAKIDSEFIEGGVNIAEAVLPGDSTKEILLSSYLCHPSLANNELSGPLTLVGLYDRLVRWPRRRFTYRFVINPETIGALCYLSERGEHLRKHLIGGLVLTCLGGPQKSLSFKKSRLGTSVLDKLVDHLSARTDCEPAIRKRRFTPVGGSDERQYCAPGFNFPVLQVGRSLYGEYEGYHNSLDTKEFMGMDSITDSIDRLENFLSLAETAATFENLQPFGEPHLGNRNLYPTESWTPSYDQRRNCSLGENLPVILHLLSFCDGSRPNIDLCSQEGFNIEDLVEPLAILEQQNLLALR